MKVKPNCRCHTFAEGLLPIERIFLVQERGVWLTPGVVDPSYKRHELCSKSRKQPGNFLTLGPRLIFVQQSLVRVSRVPQTPGLAALEGDDSFQPGSKAREIAVPPGKRPFLLGQCSDSRDFLDQMPGQMEGTIILAAPLANIHRAGGHRVLDQNAGFQLSKEVSLVWIGGPVVLETSKQG